jgi:hypothetical protein
MSVGAFPFDDQFLTAGADPDREEAFEVLEVLVVVAKQRFGALVGDRNLAHDGGRRYSGNSFSARKLQIMLSH